MTKFVVCAVFDSAVQAYSRPFFVPSVGMAVRSFTDEVNRRADDNPMWNHADDFELRFLAEFEDASGNFHVPEGEGGRCLCRAKDVKRD